MFAIIKTGGKQIKVQQGDEIFVEKLEVEEGKKVIFNDILMIDSTIGTPFIKGATVAGTVVKQGKGKKLRVVRYHPKKNVNKVYGHRQPYTKVKIDVISLSGESSKTSITKSSSTPKTETSTISASKAVAKSTTNTAKSTTTTAKKTASVINEKSTTTAVKKSAVPKVEKTEE